MSLTLNTKTLTLVLAGVAAFSAAYWLNKPKESEIAIVEPISRTASFNTSSKSNPSQSRPSHPSLQPIQRVVILSENEKDVFSIHSWLPPPPRLPPPLPPLPAQIAKPVPPPLPFSLVGALDEKGVDRRVFLTKGEQLLIVKINDIVEGKYRIDLITESLVELTYLPMNLKQTISILQGGI